MDSNNLNKLLGNIIIQKENDNIFKKVLIYSTVTLLILLYFYLIIHLITNSSSKSCSIILAKYDDNSLSKSNFSNKDQYIDPNIDNYDIHYLVEQMIYKEFTPKDKKKYLNLPQVLKEKVISDYLIEKI